MSEIKKEDGNDKKAKKESVSLLKKKISYLEEELIRKENIIDKLKEENIILFKTALKNSEGKVENGGKSNQKNQ